MVDKVSMINGALGLSGGEAISTVPSLANINDGTVATRTRWAVRLWDQNYDATLSLWPFLDARARYALPKTGTPPFGYAASYTLNPKTLRVTGLQACGQSWAREGRDVLFSGGATLNVQTVDRVAPDLLSGHVADLVSARLAHRISVALSDSGAKQEQLKKNLKDQLVETLMADNWEGSSDDMIASGWWLASMTSYRPELAAIGDIQPGWMAAIGAM